MRPWSAWADDRGSAALEFITAGVLLLVRSSTSSSPCPRSRVRRWARRAQPGRLRASTCGRTTTPQDAARRGRPSRSRSPTRGSPPAGSPSTSRARRIRRAATPRGRSCTCRCASRPSCLSRRPSPGRTRPDRSRSTAMRTSASRSSHEGDDDRRQDAASSRPRGDPGGRPGRGRGFDPSARDRVLRARPRRDPHGVRGVLALPRTRPALLPRGRGRAGGRRVLRRGRGRTGGCRGRRRRRRAPAPHGRGRRLHGHGVLADEPTAGIHDLRVDGATTPDGRSARVTLSATGIPPVASLFAPDGVRIDVTSTARSVLVGPGAAPVGPAGGG